MCIELDSLRIQSFNHAMNRVRALTGLASIWDRNLQAVISVRALAHAGRIDTLMTAIRSARFLAGKAGLSEAAKALTGKLDELAALRAEVAEQSAVVDVVVLSDDFGKKGRAAKIIAAILADNLDAAAIALRFQLAMSTAKRYLSRARKQSALTTVAKPAGRRAASAKQRMAA